MPNFQDKHPLTVDPLDEIGGEPLAGSGFEDEEPEQGFLFDSGDSTEEEG